VIFQFMLSVYSVLALWFMINLEELVHTLSRSSGRSFCWLLEIPHAIKVHIVWLYKPSFKVTLVR